MAAANEFTVTVQTLSGDYFESDWTYPQTDEEYDAFRAALRDAVAHELFPGEDPAHVRVTCEDAEDTDIPTHYFAFVDLPTYTVDDRELPHPESMRGRIIHDSIIEFRNGKIYRGARQRGTDYLLRTLHVQCIADPEKSFTYEVLVTARGQGSMASLEHFHHDYWRSMGERGAYDEICEEDDDYPAIEICEEDDDYPAMWCTTLERCLRQTLAHYQARKDLSEEEQIAYMNPLQPAAYYAAIEAFLADRTCRTHCATVERLFEEAFRA